MASNYSENDDKYLYNQRVADMAAESGKILTPIKGYEKKSLVTLEEAIEPIVSLVPDVQQMAHVAKTRCADSPADGLSVDESASIMLYTMEWYPQEACLYYVLNDTLRSENRQKLIPWFLFLKLILTAFERLPASNRPVVYRGVRQDMTKQYSTGKTMIWWGFSSCVDNMGVLSNEQFLGLSGTRTLFTIETTSGKNIQRLSYFENENEILLPPGRQFEVVSCLKQSGDLYMIQLRETEPKYPHLEPLRKGKLNILLCLFSIF